MAKNQEQKPKKVNSDRVQNAINVAQAKAKDRQMKVDVAAKNIKEINIQAIKKAKVKK